VASRTLDYRSKQTPPDGPGPSAWWRGGRLIPYVAAAAGLALVLFYADASRDLVAYRLTVDGLLLLAWLLSSAGLGAFLLRPLLRRERPGATLYFVTSAAAGLGVLSLCVLGLGLAGLLGQVTSFALLLSGLALGAVALRAHLRERGASGQGQPGPVAAGQTAWSWLWLLAVPFAAVAVVGDMVPPGLLWKPDEPLGYDVAEYHLQVPREWYEAGRIAPLKHNAFSYMPLGVETHYLLAMHVTGGPWIGMYLAQLMHAAMLALSVAAVAGFARRWTGSGARAALAGAAAATVPWLAQLGAVAYNEGGLLLYGALALGWAADATRCPGPRRGLWRFLLGGAMAGFACGAKLTAVPVILMAVPVVALVGLICTRYHSRSATGPQGLPPSRDGIARDLASVAAFPLAGLLLFSPWLVRNLAWTGNPVFPEGTALFGKAHFSDEQVERWNRAHGPRPEQRPAAARARAAWREVVTNWQFGYVLIPASLAAAGLAWRRPEAWFLAGFLVLLAAFWLGFTHLQSRFFVMAVPACAVLLALPEWKPWLPVAAGVVGIGAVPGFWQLHGRIQTQLGLAQMQALGRERIDWLMDVSVPPSFPREDPDAVLTLVGEARAFWYPLPMSRLRYRTIFDADTSGGRTVLEAWTAGWAPRPGEWILIEPRELRRFAGTYQPFPEFPGEWTEREEWRAGMPFFLERSGRGE
jgi:hypothetical protein